GVLLQGGSSEAGRQRLALLHPIPLRPGFWEVGDGEGSGVSHHRLIARLLGTLRLPETACSWLLFSRERQSPPPGAGRKGHFIGDGLVSRKNRNATTRTAAWLGDSQATAAA